MVLSFSTLSRSNRLGLGGCTAESLLTNSDCFSVSGRGGFLAAFFSGRNIEGEDTEEESGLPKLFVTSWIGELRFVCILFDSGLINVWMPLPMPLCSLYSINRRSLDFLLRSLPLNFPDDTDCRCANPFFLAASVREESRAEFLSPCPAMLPYRCKPGLLSLSFLIRYSFKSFSYCYLMRTSRDSAMFICGRGSFLSSVYMSSGLTKMRYCFRAC